jgi:hypothetical protein
MTAIERSRYRGKTVERRGNVEASQDKQAQRVIVVSLMKSGTHLLQDLMARLGYGIYGESHIPTDARPDFDIRARADIARLVYGDDMLLETDHDRFVTETDLAWSALGWAWQLRLGMPLANHYGMDLTHTGLVQETLQRTIASSFSETPGNLCWILPGLNIRKTDGAFLREWAATGNPKIIFNYRDPCDVVLSMVNFLGGKTAQGYGSFRDFAVYNKILRSMESIESRLTYALTDPFFPGIRDFEETLWLLRHPDVCKVSFEELVGPEGGGSTEAQLCALARLTEFIGADVRVEDFAGSLFNRDSFSFHYGQIGRWRSSFTPEHREIVQQRFGQIVSAYGYQRDPQ